MRVNHITPIYIALILLAYNTLNVFLHNGNYVPVFEYFLLVFLFSIILGSVCKSLSKNPLPLKSKIYILSKGYIWVSLLSITGAFLSFFLLVLGFKSYEAIEADFLSSNIENGAWYYRSFLSVNSAESILRVPFFQDFGILCGLFHEPHVFAYNAFPCIFLLYGFTNRNHHLMKGLLITTGVLVILFSGSTTNILALAGTLLILFLIKVRSNFFEVIISVVLVLLLVIYYIGRDGTLYEFVLGRLAADNYSQQFSVSLLEFAFTPKTVFGSDFMATDFVSGSTSQDVGFIPFFLNISFLVFYLKNTILLLKKGDQLSLFVSLASIYFILHSLKVGMTMYIQTPYVFLVFLQSFILCNYGRIKTTKSSLPN